MVVPSDDSFAGVYEGAGANLAGDARRERGEGVAGFVAGTVWGEDGTYSDLGRLNTGVAAVRFRLGL